MARRSKYDRRSTAFHEAGHAVAAHVIGCGVISASTIPSQASITKKVILDGKVEEVTEVLVGEVMEDVDVAMLEEEMMIRDEGGQIPFLFLLRDPAVHIERTRAAIVVCFAGPAAEEHFLEERFMEGIGQGSDYSNALALAKRITADSKRARQLMIELTGDARKFVRSHWRCITAVAFELRDHGGLDGDQLAEIIERWPIRRAL